MAITDCTVDTLAMQCILHQLFAIRRPLLVLAVVFAVSSNNLTLQVAGLNIYVDRGGTNDSTCVTGGEEHPCATLELALQGLGLHNGSTVWISEGTYTLTHHSGSSTAQEGVSYRYVWMKDIAIASRVGDHTHINPETPWQVRVECQDSVGLAFVYVSNVTLRGVEFVGCAAPQYSTSRISSGKPFQQFRVGLYFLYVISITMDHVSVTGALGTGVVMYASTGKNTITDCNFSDNYSEEGTSGGGGLYIEFPYCTPTMAGDVQNCSKTSNIPTGYVENGEYMIESCIFNNNTAKIQNETDSTFILPHWETHLAFGRGAGLSVFFKGYSMNNRVLLNNCHVMNNRALWGAGLFVEHQDASYNNTFNMESSVLDSNFCFHHTSEQKGTGGGGMRIGHVFFDKGAVTSTHMLFRNISFISNRAYYGGGVSLYTTRESTKSSATNTVQFHDCMWEENVARVGSAVDLSVWHPVPFGAIAIPVFSDCTFWNNTGHYTKAIGMYVGIGAFYSDSIPVDFSGETRFEENSPSALASVAARLRFQPNSRAVFSNNTGRNGGAMALMGYGAFLEVSPNVNLRFVGNSADLKGGAIYGESIGEHDLISSRNCFIRYSDVTVTPWEWEAIFYFENNTVNSVVNSIYVTSLLTCLWGGAYGSSDTLEEAKEVFCWNSDATSLKWIYNNSGNCTDEIATSPAKVVDKAGTLDCIGSEDAVCSFDLNVIPGLTAVLPFYTTDDGGNNVTNTTVLTARFLNTISDRDNVHLDSSSGYISDNSVKLTGAPNSPTYRIQFETISPRVISVPVDIRFSDCPPGMIISPESNDTCTCGGDYLGIVHCHSNKFVSELRRGGWIGKLENSSIYVAGQCPYCASFAKLLLPQNVSELESALCNSINRTGVLCGHCLPGYGPVVNGDGVQCHKCTAAEAKYNWIFYLMTEFLPITIFFFIVVLFNVNTTSGPANAFVFFAQVLTSSFNIDGDGSVSFSKITNASDVLAELYIIPYGIWNLNFFHPLLPKFCLSSSVSTLQVLSTGYITALYPLLLVIVFSAFVWAYGRGIRPIVCLCRPIHKCFARLRSIWNLQRSIVHALATFIILSYTKFALVSFVLLTDMPLVDDVGKSHSRVVYYDGTIPYMGADHLPYVIASFVALATFVALPPIILSIPSLILLIKKLYKVVLRKDLDLPASCSPGPRLDQFLNAFHGCYKDGTGGGGGDNNVDCRWFAGFYFILRLILFLVFAFTPFWFLQYVVQQLVCILALLLVVIFRPYKNQFFNIVDSCIFANLAIITTLSMFNFYIYDVTGQVYAWAFVTQYVLIVLPLFYMGGYVLYILWAKYGSSFRKCRSLPEAKNDDNEAFLEYADNEERYRNIHGSYQIRSAMRSPSTIFFLMRKKSEIQCRVCVL